MLPGVWKKSKVYTIDEDEEGFQVVNGIKPFGNSSLSPITLKKVLTQG